MLRFADELLFLLIDDKRGDLIPIPEWSLACALAGALLMDLALEGRIDTDPDYLSLLDATPLGDDLLDPVLEEIAQAEADALFEYGEPTVRGIQHLDVTRRVYLETLRLYGTVPRTVRTVANSFEFSGCTVPAGRQVILDFTLTHHLPEFFPDPEQFDIDRFAPPRNEHRQTAVYMPYGVGTHRCLGEDLAEFMTMTAMATLLHDVELALDPPGYTLTGWKIKGLPTRHPGKSFRFRLVRRRSASGGGPSIAAAGD